METPPAKSSEGDERARIGLEEFFHYYGRHKTFVDLAYALTKVGRDTTAGLLVKFIDGPPFSFSPSCTQRYLIKWLIVNIEKMIG